MSEEESFEIDTLTGNLNVIVLIIATQTSISTLERTMRSKPNVQCLTGSDVQKVSLVSDPFSIFSKTQDI